MGKELSVKGWTKTSYKRYEAYVCMPELGTKVVNKVVDAEYITDKGANFVLSTLDGDMCLCSANYLAKYFEFADGSSINAENLKKRATIVNLSLCVDWVKIVRKPNEEYLWVYCCEGNELRQVSNKFTNKENIKDKYFLISQDINDAPDTAYYTIEDTKNFIYKYDLRAFPGILKSFSDDEMKLVKPESLLDISVEDTVNKVGNDAILEKELSLKELASIFYNNLKNVECEYLKNKNTTSPYIEKIGKPSVDIEKGLVVCKNILKVNNLPFDYYSILQVSKTGVCSIINTVDYKKVIDDLPQKAIFETETKSIINKAKKDIPDILFIDFNSVYKDALRRLNKIVVETMELNIIHKNKALLSLENYGDIRTVIPNQVFINLLTSDNFEALSYILTENRTFSMSFLYTKMNYEKAITIKMEDMTPGPDCSYFSNDIEYRYIIYDYYSKELIYSDFKGLTRNELAAHFMLSIHTNSITEFDNCHRYYLKFDGAFQAFTDKFANIIENYFYEKAYKLYYIDEGVWPEDILNTDEFEMKIGCTLDIKSLMSILKVSTDKKKEMISKILKGFYFMYKGIEDVCKDNSISLDIAQDVAEIESNMIRLEFSYTDNKIDYNDIGDDFEDISPWCAIIWDNENNLKVIYHVMSALDDYDINTSVPYSESRAREQINEFIKLCNKAINDNIEYCN